MKSNTLGDKVVLSIVYFTLFLLFLVTLYPFWQVLILSISSRKEALTMGLHLSTKEVDFTAYKQVLQTEEFWLYFKNSIVRVVVGTLLSVLMVSLTAYPLSKSDLPFNKTITSLFLFTMMFSGGLIPTYLVIKSLKLTNTIWALILPYSASAYNIIIMRNFLRSIPGELTESAYIDGANEFQIWYKIILPLSKPAMATIALWVAVVQWNAYLDVLIYITDRNKYVLPIILRRVLIENQSSMYISNDMSGVITTPTEETVKSALIMVSTLPIVAVYPFLQKYFTKGIMLGAVKG